MGTILFGFAPACMNIALLIVQLLYAFTIARSGNGNFTCFTEFYLTMGLFTCTLQGNVVLIGDSAYATVFETNIINQLSVNTKYNTCPD